MIKNTFSLLLSIFLVANGTQLLAEEGAASLVKSIQSAIAAKSIADAEKLVDWGDAPLPAYRMFRMSVADCFAPTQCKIESIPISEDEKKPQTDYFFPVVPEGKIRIAEPGEGDGFSMPYAKIDGQYRIIIGRQTEEGYARTKAATDASKIAADFDPDLVSGGTPLPADGGDPAKAYLEYNTAINKGDQQFLAQKGSASDKYFFGSAYKDNPVKAGITLDLLKKANIESPQIKGGFLKDNRAILLIVGKNGMAWHSEGAVLLTLLDKKWQIEDTLFQSYPIK